MIQTILSNTFYSILACIFLSLVFMILYAVLLIVVCEIKTYLRNKRIDKYRKRRFEDSY